MNTPPRTSKDIINEAVIYRIEANRKEDLLRNTPLRAKSLTELKQKKLSKALVKAEAHT